MLFSDRKIQALAKRSKNERREARKLKLAGASTQPVNALEQARITMALSRVQMLALLALPVQRRELFTLSDAELAAESDRLLKDCTSLCTLHEQWQADVLSKVQHGRLYATHEAAHLLGLSEAHMYRLITRGLVVPARSSPRAHVFDYDAIASSFARGAGYVKSDPKGRMKGPFANVFVKWLREQGRWAAANATPAHDGYSLAEMAPDGA